MTYLNISNFTTASWYCRKTLQHGGAVILVNNNVKYKPRDDIVINSLEYHCELAAVELVDFDLVIVTSYRSPQGDINIFTQCLNKILEILNKTKKKIIFNGDFNVRFNYNEKNSNIICDTFLSFNMEKTIRENTRNTNCLDNIFVSISDCADVLYKSYVIDPNLSDHKAVVIDLKFTENNIKKTSFRYIRPISEAGLYKFYNLIENCDFNFIDNVDYSVNKKCEVFMDILVKNASIAFPTLKKRESGYKKIDWYTENLRNTKNTLEFFIDLNKNNPSDELKQYIKNLRATYRKDISCAKKQANHNYIDNSTNKQKSMWNLINIERKNVKQNVVCEDLTANDFNNHFIDVPNHVIEKLKSTKNHIPNPITYLNNINCQHSFNFREVTYNEVRDAINQLKNKNSTDIFGLNYKMLKAIKNLLIIPLTKLFNSIIMTSTYPEIFKITKIIPIFKTGDLTELVNYRPIALLSVVSKILEILLKNQITAYFEDNNLLSNTQFGFRKHKSTEKAVMALVEKVIKGFENKEYVGTMFCDLSKAFDCISHKTLLSKLAQYGFDNKSTQLIDTYLKDRQQSCYYNQTYSERQTVKHGVPQGSVLGPILFLIYINDLPIAIPSTDFMLFADDTTATNGNKNLNSLLTDMTENRCLAIQWFSANQLLLNDAKTNIMLFTNRNLHGYQNLEHVKLLGVYLDAGLKWDEHVNFISKKLNKNLYLLRKLYFLLPLNAMKTCYFSVFHSVLKYCILSWGHSPHSHRIFGIQRQAIRAMSGLDYREDVRPKFIEHAILTLPCIYILECLVHIQSNRDSYKTQEEIHNYPTRQRNNIRIEYTRLLHSRNAYNYYGPLFHNKLPHHIKNLQLGKFKSIVIKFLTKKAFYSFNEYFDTNFEEMDN